MPILTSIERIGTTVADKFELISVLGRGGMGVVYQAVHRWTGRRVAVKLIDPALAEDPELATRFLHEARAAASLSHPNVVDVLDMGRDEDGTVYQVLELLEGETLAARLDRQGKLSVAEALPLLMPIMDALELAHAHGIVHRDVKPDNVFLRDASEGVQPVLLDFGMAKLLDARAVTTRSSAVFGTAHYMAPEQALGAKNVGPAADVWSMGVMWFECLTGELPFGEGPAAAYLARVVYEHAKPLRELSPELDVALANAIDGALARDLETRPATMAALIDNVRKATSAAADQRSAGSRPTFAAALRTPVPAQAAAKTRGPRSSRDPGRDSEPFAVEPLGKTRSRAWLAVAAAAVAAVLGAGALFVRAASAPAANSEQSRVSQAPAVSAPTALSAPAERGELSAQPLAASPAQGPDASAAGTLEKPVPRARASLRGASLKRSRAARVPGLRADEARDAASAEPASALPNGMTEEW